MGNNGDVGDTPGHECRANIAQRHTFECRARQRAFIFFCVALEQAGADSINKAANMENKRISHPISQLFRKLSLAVNSGHKWQLLLFLAYFRA